MEAGKEIDVSDEALNKPLKKLEEYDPAFVNNSEFFSSYNPDMIEEALISYLHKEESEFKVNKEKYKIKFKLFVTDSADSKFKE